MDLHGINPMSQPNMVNEIVGAILMNEGQCEQCKTCDTPYCDGCDDERLEYVESLPMKIEELRRGLIEIKHVYAHDKSLKNYCEGLLIK